MKSGLYACAGASATASAAAWAKRFDEPITNRSNVYFGFSPDSLIRCGRRPRSCRARRAPSRRRSAGPGALAGRVADGGADQLEEMPLDPLAREVVRNGEDEASSVSSDALDLAEPRPVGGVVERALEPPGDLGPEVSAVSSIGCSTRAASAPPSTTARGEHSNVLGRRYNGPSGEASLAKTRRFPGISPRPHVSPQVWKELSRG